jgi:hypothetical protein
MPLRICAAPVMNVTIAVVVLLVLFTGQAGQAQSSGQAKPQPTGGTKLTMPSAAIPTADAARITTLWALVANGRAAEAVPQAEALLQQHPDSPAVLALAIEASIAGRGGQTSLDIYERWLAARPDERLILRRIARAYLHEWARQTADTVARIEALRSLAAIGDQDAMAVLEAGSGQPAESRALVALGNPQAIDRVVARLKATPGSKTIEILVLSESRSPRVVPVLVGLLGDARREHRAQAADALGKVGQKDAIPALQKALADPEALVRTAAAGALFRLGDATGIGQIRELATSQYAAARMTAANIMAGVPDDEWKAIVRGLAAESDSAYRLQAARLMAPHDQAFSHSVLTALLSDANPEIRDEAGVTLARDLPNPDLPLLRRLLRLNASRTRVAAAARLFEILR